MVGRAVTEVAVDDCRTGVRPVHCATSAGFTVVNVAVNKFRLAVFFEGDSTAVAYNDIVRHRNEGSIRRVVIKGAVYKFRTAPVGGIDRAAEVFNIQGSVRSWPCAAAYTADTTVGMVVGEGAVEEFRRTLVFTVYGATITAVFPVILEVAIIVVVI